MFGEQGFDMNALLAQAQAMQSQIQRAQDELAAKQVRGSAGGDLVQVTVSGSGELLAVDIKPEAWDDDDPSTLGDLIVAAVRDANKKVAILAESSMPQLPDLGGLGGLPGQ
ncbi:MAG: YbaB/EbfC family nucleoid-associated protein [Micropruina sp.]|uniref:YbaB/EbfC family nucleoid-associated protein n=1 Tax=Micropruina sp. TaxID=2737536 RepID=UPI0039E2C55D